MLLSDLPAKDLNVGLVVMGANGTLGEVISTYKGKDGLDVEIRWEHGRTIHIWQHQGTHITIL